MRLVTEDPTLLLWAAALGALLLVVAFFATKRARYLLWIIPVAVVALAAVVIDRLVVTDREEVELALEELVEAVVEGDAARVIAGVSPDKEALQRLVGGVVARYDVHDVSVGGLSVEMHSPRLATASFRTAADVSGPNLPRTRSYDAWELDFVRRAAENDDDAMWLLDDVRWLTLQGVPRDLRMP